MSHAYVFANDFIGMDDPLNRREGIPISSCMRPDTTTSGLWDNGWESVEKRNQAQE